MSPWAGLGWAERSDTHHFILHTIIFVVADFQAMGFESPSLVELRRGSVHPTRSRHRRHADNRSSQGAFKVQGYDYIELPVTNCVHFVQTYASSLESRVEAMRKSGIRFVYWSYLDGGREATTIADPLAIALGLEHAPYGNLPWVPFLDDLITLAYRCDGLVIVIDRCDVLIEERRDDMFDCLGAFLHQVHHWYDQKKPCHLCFQMVKDASVTELFTREAGR